MKNLFIALLIIPSFLSAQDTVKFQWPVTPFNTSQVITGTFCEFRNTLSANHFHSGTDIPKADGSPVYSVLDGIVNSLGTSATEGTSAFVRIRTQTPQGWKHISYVHIEPNPAISVGQSVTKGVTILGYILNQQGHTHLTERELVATSGGNGVEIGAWRNGGGLTPYIDTYPPEVLWVKFFQDNSSVEFTSKKVYGKIDIVAQMIERNGTTASSTNNGVYQTGYKILSANKDSVVYNPPTDGTRYKFDYKPSDTYANVIYTLQSNTSTHIYYLTNGNGTHGMSTSSNSRNVPNNFLDVSLFPPGNYQVMVFAKDTRGNADTIYVPFEISNLDVVPPAPPILRAVVNDSTNKVTVRWYANTEPDLKGYRLYSSINGSTWNLQKDETVLNRNTTSYSFTGISQTTPVFFRISAVDSAGITNESEFSDTYGLRPNVAGKKVLLIDAFDRISDSYKKLQHNFSAVIGQSVTSRFETAHNKAVVDGSVSLLNYDAVVWSFGDEGSTDETFGATEQSKAIAYLNAGGKIFVNGSEVAYDLDRSSGPSEADRNFFNNNLKSSFAGDASGSATINGVAGTLFEGLSFAYGDTLQGSPYRENFPDYLNPINGSSIVLKYANNLNAATAFGGSVVVLGIPVETIHSKTHRDALMNAVLKYFDITTSIVERDDDHIPAHFSLEQNFPNPFNPSTVITYQLPIKSSVTLKIYDVIGRELATIVNETQSAGKYSVQWNAAGLSSGVYLYRLQTNEFSSTKKLVLTK